MKRMVSIRSLASLLKKARGMMVRYVIDNKITKVEDIKNFDYDGYQYSEELSKGNDWVFTRDEK